jgi:4-amino-4-deoxy-L-arabinose transferase-like glycosyltransferase
MAQAVAQDTGKGVAVHARRGLSRFEWACLGVVAFAFLMRVDLVMHPDVIWDSGWYLVLSRSFADTGTFVMPWTDPPQYNGYWPPLFPIFLSPLVKVFGPSYGVEVVGACLATALLTLAAFLCTRDLFGRTRAFAAAALVAANPAFFVSDSRGMSESVLALAIALTVWAFLKSLQKPGFLPLAGVFGALSYLGKPNLGAPFVAAGVVAIGVWRVAKRGWRRVLTSPLDLTVGGVALAGVLVLAITRPVKLGGVGLSLIAPLQAAWLHPRMIDVLGMQMPFYVAVFPFKLAFAAGFLAAVTLPFSLHVGGAVRAWRDERTGALWLATLIPLVAGAVFTTTFYMTEGRQLVDFDNIRYLTPAILPAIWLCIPSWPAEDDPTAPAGRPGAMNRTRHDAWFGLAVALYVALLLLSPIAGNATLSRLQLLLTLSFVPLGMALVASRLRYATATRRSAGGEVEARYVEAKADATPRGAWLAVLGVMAVDVLFVILVGNHKVPDVAANGDVILLFLTFGALLSLALLARPKAWPGILAVGLLVGSFAYWVSSWYVCVALGLAIAMCAVSRKAAAVTLALVLLCATAPGFNTPFPAEAFARDVHKYVPAGTVIGVEGPIVYAAGVAPSDVTLREMPYPPPDAFDAALISNTLADQQLPNFTRVASWSYEFGLSPTFAARLWLEKHVFSEDVQLNPGTGVALFLRTNSTLYQRLPSS